MNGYNLLRDWYNYKFSNPSKVKANHSDMYCYLIDRWNRLGQKNEFGLPTSVTMEALGIGSYNTYKRTIDDLVDFGFIEVITESKNQHQSRIIALSKNDEATDKALDEATAKATDKSPDTINKQKNNRTKESIVPFENGTTHEKIDFDGLLMFINKTFGRSFKGILEPVRKKYNARIKEGYKLDDIINAVNNCHKDQFHREHNYKYCTPEFFSRSQTLDKYSETTKQEKIVIASHPYVYD
jgi:uncharacterized phage protein (TIGR02220 family)